MESGVGRRGGRGGFDETTANEEGNGKKASVSIVLENIQRNKKSTFSFHFFHVSAHCFYIARRGALRRAVILFFSVIFVEMKVVMLHYFFPSRLCCLISKCTFSAVQFRFGWIVNCMQDAPEKLSQ